MINSQLRVLFLLCLTHFTVAFNLAGIIAVIPNMSRDLGQPDVIVAHIIPIYMWAYGIFALFYAPLTAFFSIRTLFIAAMALYAVSSFYCAMTHSIAAVYIASFLNGAAAASVVPMGLILIGKLYAKNERGKAVGFFFGASFLAALAGVITSGVLSWEYLFYLPAFIALVTILFLWMLPLKELREKELRPVNYWTALKDPLVLRIFVFVFVMSFLYHGIHKWYGVFLDCEYQLSQAKISSFVLLTTTAGAFGQVVGGYLTDKFGRSLSCRWGIFLLGVGVIALSIKHSLILLGVVLAFVSIGWTVSHNAIATVLTDFPDQFRAEISGLNSTVRFFSGGLGFYLSQFLIHISFSLNFFVIGTGFLLSLFFLKKFVLVTSHGKES